MPREAKAWGNAQDMLTRGCATRRQICTVQKHLLPVVGQQVYPPSLRAEQPVDEGSPGETTGSTGVVAYP